MMKGGEVESEKKILDPDWMPVAEAAWEAKIKVLDEGANPRLILKMNTSLKVPFYAVIDIKNNTGVTPFVVCVARADQDIIALGILEKLKIMVHQLQRKLNIGAKLSVGVTDHVLSNLKTGKA